MKNIKTISVEQMRKSDAWTIKNLVPSKELMKRAGDAIFNEMIKTGCKGPVAIICGTGNNAGDGYVVASDLADNNIECKIILAADKFSEDGKYYFDKCLEKEIPVMIYDKDNLKNYHADNNQTSNDASANYDTSFNNNVNSNNTSIKNLDLSKYNTIVDCMLGTGFSGCQVRPNMAALINAINESGKKGTFVVSADINSGLNGDTGKGELFVISDLTVSIGFFKHGHFKGQANTAMKNKVNCDIGIKLI